jgi:hypothetical protein
MVALSCLCTIGLMELYLLNHPHHAAHHQPRRVSHLVTEGLHAPEYHAATHPVDVATGHSKHSTSVIVRIAEKKSKKSKLERHKIEKPAVLPGDARKQAQAEHKQEKPQQQAKAQEQAKQQQAGASGASSQECGQLSREFLAQHAVNNTILLAACDWHMFEVRHATCWPL